jgi:hypothetical protein
VSLSNARCWSRSPTISILISLIRLWFIYFNRRGAPHVLSARYRTHWRTVFTVVRPTFAVSFAMSEMQTMNCQIEHVSSDSDVGMPCSNRAVATDDDCGAAICADCRVWCCGESFCQWCSDYHTTHSCLRKSVQNECDVFGSYKS